MKFEIERGKEIFRWGPIPLKCAYAGTFFQVFQKKYLSKYGFIWSDALLVMHKGDFVFIQDDAELKKTAGEIFRTHIMTPQYDDYVSAMQRAVQALYQYYQNITPEKLADLPQDEFLGTARQFNTLTIAFELPTIAPEFGNYGSIPILEHELSRYIPDEQKRAEAVALLTTSENKSFFQTEETELQETEDIESHRNKYFWLKNSYDHVEVLPVAFFAKRKVELEPDLRRRHEEHVRQVREDKKRVIEDCSIPESVIRIAERIIDAMELQDERKKEMLLTHHYKDVFMCEFSKRGVLQAERYMLSELADILEGKREVWRTEDFGFLLHDGELEEYGELDAQKYWAEYAHQKVEQGVQEFKGTIACKGEVVRGRARIVVDPEDVAHVDFNKGDILVAPMTSPEYVFLMKKVAAIITDTGGLTSHAAIVSRELGVPCIVGTKFATQVLRDGDMVEVDAEKGIVRKL